MDKPIFPEEELVQNETGGTANEFAHVWQSNNADDETINKNRCNDPIQTTEDISRTKMEQVGHVVTSDNGLKMTISTTLGKSWVHNEHILCKQNGEIGPQITNNNDRENNGSPTQSLDIVCCDKMINSNSETPRLEQEDCDMNPPEIDNIPDKAISTVVNAINNEGPLGGKLLSHWEIMKKCLNRKLLYECLNTPPKKPPVYRCTLCSFRRKSPQYVLIHLRSHKDLTSVFELYQKYEQQQGITGNDNQLLETKKKESRTSRKKMASSENLHLMNNMEIEMNDNSNNDTYSNISTDSESSHQLEKPLKKRKLRKRRRKKLEALNLAGASDEDSISGESYFDTKRKAFTDFETSDVEEYFSKPKRLMRRKSLGQLIFGDSFVSDPYDGSHVTDDNNFIGMHRENLSESVSAENPHFCTYCGMKFTRGTGIFRHYQTHNPSLTTQPEQKRKSNKKKKNEKVSTVCQTNLSYNSSTSFAKLERARKETLSLYKLEGNMNKVLEYFVRDITVLTDIGWPNRNINELLIEILHKCNINPTYEALSTASKLDSLRRNASELISFCIKDEVMEDYGWRDQVVDDVLLQLIEKVKEINSSNDF